MTAVKEKDFAEIRSASLISDNDTTVLLALYQPLVGHVSIALFLTLFNAWKLERDQVFSIGDFLSLTDMNLNAFNLARQRLEGVGLLRTYYEQEKDFSFYTFELYAPKSPYDFFDDQLFKGMLIKSIGLKATNHLLKLFQADEVVNGKQEISASFVEVFRPDFNDPAYNNALNNFASSIRHGKLDVDFDDDKFFEELLKQGMIKRDALASDEYKHAKQLGTLYGVDEQILAKCVISSYAPDETLGQRVNFLILKNYLDEEKKYTFAQPKSKRKQLLHSEAEVSKLINAMELSSPIDFLALLQGGRPIVPSDRQLLEDLSIKYGLTNGVINALVFTVLRLKNNQLSYAYTTKIAGALVREKIDSALDATNYLRDNLKGFAKRKKGLPSNEEKGDDQDKVKIANEISDDELKELERALKEQGK
ncbi:MAG TPA: DnaD domain protein [Bacilli bacterium]|nr:DnaD domain protein [Bacilli bacterium]